MKEERKPFLTLGNSKLSKIANFTVLILLLGYAAGKLGLITPSMTNGYEYSIPASELQISSQQELSTRLSRYAIDPEKLENILQDNGMTLKEFQDNVSMELIVNTTQNGLEGLVIEFQSNIPGDKLKSTYDYISKEIKLHVINNKN